MAGRRHRGSWRDEPRSAVHAAMHEVGVSAAEYVELEFSTGWRMEPLDPERSAIDVEVLWSETRQQYRALLTEVPSAGAESGD